MSFMSSARGILGVLLFLLSVVFLMYIYFPANDKISNIPSHVALSTRKQDKPSDSGSIQFPSIVHTTWKTGSSPPAETIRWQDGCKKLNPTHEFRLYDDDDLYRFTEATFPEYFPLFKALRGVYMADMARLLLVYHFGGLYMDLDFYCFRPFSCLEKYALHQARQTMKQQGRKEEEFTDLLVVSREPLVHAELFRNKSRVVIQDFFLTTPRHPFLKWLLDDKMALFNADPAHPPKGPFSYSIEKDIDKYYRAMGLPAIDAQDIFRLPSLKGGESGVKHGRSLQASNGSTVAQPKRVRTAPVNGTTSTARARRSRAPANGTVADPVVVTAITAPVAAAAPVVVPAPSTASAPKKIENPLPIAPSSAPKKHVSLIVELREDILHPLIDATNSRLFSKCAGEEAMALTAEGKAACAVVNQKHFFSPTDDTMMVHMWTHTYLGWSFLRGTFLNWGSYSNVEKTMKPTYNCPLIE